MSSILDQFSEAVRVHPDRPAVTQCLHNGQVAKVTYAELDHRSENVAAYLRTQRIAGGDLVGVYMRRSVDHVAAILGILKAGAAFYSLNPRSTTEQVIHTAQVSRAAAVLTDAEALVNLQGIEKTEGVSFNLVVFSSKELAPFQQELFAKIHTRFPISKLSTETNPPAKWGVVGQDVALVLFTSGSTGQPKGVLISHQDLYNRVRTECSYFELGSRDVILNLLPFSFDVGANQLFTTLTSGAQLVILNSWLPADIISVISQHQITGISGVPAVWASMLNAENAEGVFRTVNLVRYITISGGDLAPSQLDRLAGYLPSVQIFKTYGQSETFRSGILLPSEFRAKMQSVGRPVKGTHVYILNKAGERAQPNEEGEIIHGGDGVMLGYLGDVKSTKKKLRLDPLQNRRGPCRRTIVHTGDIGRMDRDGYLYILGRHDKMIKTSGYRIYPKEIVDQILRHEAVQDAVVFGVPDVNTGTTVCAEIQLKATHQLTEVALKIFLSAKLPPYMIPAKVSFVTGFPRTASGKIKLAEVEEKHRGKK